MNESGLKSLDKIGLDKRVQSLIRVPTSGQIRFELNPGWVFTDLKDRVAYFDGIKDVWQAFRHNVSRDTRTAVDQDAAEFKQIETEVVERESLDDEDEPTTGRGFRAIDVPVRNSKWRCPNCRRWTTDPMGKTCQACKPQTVEHSEIPVDKV